MTASEMFKRIEDNFYNGIEFSTDTEWLLSRIRTLEKRNERLKDIILVMPHKRSSNSMKEDCASNCYACFAFKGLSDEGAGE